MSAPVDKPVNQRPMECGADGRVHWTFFGRIVPERHPLAITPPSSTATFEEIGLTFDYSIGIADGQFTADVTIKKGKVDVNTLRNIVESQIRVVTDLAGYMLGGSFDVDITGTVCRNTGDRCIFGIVIPILKAKRMSIPSAIDGATFSSVHADNAAMIALANFREAMRSPIDTGFFCFRAIEAMMQSMKSNPKEKKDDKAWTRFRDMLRVDRRFIDEIQRHAVLVRHGKPSSISDAERAKIFDYTDRIIERYLIYIVGGRTRLSATDFEILKV